MACACNQRRTTAWGSGGASTARARSEKPEERPATPSGPTYLVDGETRERFETRVAAVAARVSLGRGRLVPADEVE